MKHIKKLIQMLGSHPEGRAMCISGNEAVVRGALEAGVSGVFAYPGTPSTEIGEAFRHIRDFHRNPDLHSSHPELSAPDIYSETSINARIALEKAIAYTIAGRAALCCMKSVGLNVAADPLMTITYQVIEAPLVLVVCDDPGCHSSSNEQDSRLWGKMAHVPVYHPASPARARAFTIAAFRLSESLKLPVILRMTTRVCHTRGPVAPGPLVQPDNRASFRKLPEHINIPARTSAAHRKLRDKLATGFPKEFFPSANRFLDASEPIPRGVITSGVASVYLEEHYHRAGLQAEFKVLDLGLIHPFPREQVARFIQGLQRVLVLEELEPYVEDEVRILAQKRGLGCTILGKGFAGLEAVGELSLDIVHTALASFIDRPLPGKQGLPAREMEQLTAALPPRPPMLCAGCPHRATYYLLKLAIPRDAEAPILCGDIGCLGLGALPPLKMIDTINHMGMSISMAQGLDQAFRSGSGSRKTVALLGDGTFFHSGVPALLNALYANARLLLVIFDNRTVAMTGGQSHPGAADKDRNEIAIDLLLKGIGVPMVETIDPFDTRAGLAVIRAAMEAPGISVIVARSPCVRLKSDPTRKPRVAVDPNLCNHCANHEDPTLACSKINTAAGNLSRARARLGADFHIPAERQRCPANICNHGFFNAILGNESKTAVEVIRDKILFARTCGHICHRPCELFAGSPSVPIKKLKKYVSSIDSNFYDFSEPARRVRESRAKGKKVAVVGAGPAGLSAAYDLIQQGYLVTVYEKRSQPGGLIQAVIPKFRMDKDGFDFEVAQLAELGVVFRYGVALGRDLFPEKLCRQYDAVLLAIGLGRPKPLPHLEEAIPPDHCLNALTFLEAYNNGSLEIHPGSRFLVIGGGNSAIDAARAAARLAEKNQVFLSCIEKEPEMPAFTEEIGHARAEGVTIFDGTEAEPAPTDTEPFRFQLLEYGSGRFRTRIAVDYLILAIGQVGDVSSYPRLDPSLVSPDGRIRADREGGFTGWRNLFVAGDLHAGNHLSFIGAIAGGKRAAVGIRRFLEAYPFAYEGLSALEQLNTTPAGIARADPGELDLSRFDLYQSCGRCNHCIDNFGCPALVKVDGKMQINDDLCTNCGLCIDVCPNHAIHWVCVHETDPYPSATIDKPIPV